MPQIKLFGISLAPFVEKVRLALIIKELEFELVKPKSLRDLRRWSPQTRRVPVLEINGERIYDSTLICDHLDKLFPDKPLLSSHPETRARQRFIEDWSDESLYWYVVALRWSEKNAPATAKQITKWMPVQKILHPIVKYSATRHYKAMSRAQGIGALPDDIIVDQLSERLDDLCTMIGDKPFFTEQISRADLSVYGMLNSGMSGPTPEIGDLVHERPILNDFMDRISDLTNTQRLTAHS